MNGSEIPGIWSPYSRLPDDVDNGHTEQSDGQDAIPEFEMPRSRTPGSCDGQLKASIRDLIPNEVRAQLERSFKL